MQFRMVDQHVRSHIDDPLNDLPIGFYHISSSVIRLPECYTEQGPHMVTEFHDILPLSTYRFYPLHTREHMHLVRRSVQTIYITIASTL